MARLPDNIPIEHPLHADRPLGSLEGAEQEQASPRKVRSRAFLLAIPLMIVNAYWTMALWGRAGYATGQSFPSIVSLYYNVIFSLLIILGGNAFLKRVLPRYAFNEAEILLLTIMLTVSSSIGGHDMLEIVWPSIAYIAWFGTPENHWGQFQQHLPEGLVLKNHEALRDFFIGHSTLYTRQHLLLWLYPVALWSLIMFVLGGMMLCMVTLLNERWVQHERLSYPNIQLPLAMCDPRGTLFRNRFMWAGFCIAGGIDLINGLHYLYPQIPGLGGTLTEYSLNSLFTSRPFSAMGWTPVGLYPFAVGMTYFIPLDLSFSIWFFYLLGRGVRIVGDMWGATSSPEFPYPVEQGAGAWLGIAIVALWTSRHYLKEQWVRARQSGQRQGDEPLSPRSALLGLAFGMLFLLVLGVIASVPIWWMALFFALFFAISLALTRVRAEVGPPSHDIQTHPLRMMVTSFGGDTLGAPALGVFTLFTAFNRTYRSHPMPGMLEGFAMFSRRNMSSRPLVGGIILALLVGTLASAWTYLDHAYTYGGAIFGEQGQLQANFNQMATWSGHRAPSQTASLLATAVGLAGIFGLMGLRRVFPLNPFHPTGYAISLGTWNTNWFWFSIFVGWLLKWALIHLGGLRIYRQSLPFFMGLILGEFVMGAVWSILGIALKMPMYRFLQ
ncbi:hypothetical protein LBMAG21_07490 [Armatimonadota bacterium]|nr:hypothetical protein LBMAG21_07490 [Armatimonadota bacterium]